MKKTSKDLDILITTRQKSVPMGKCVTIEAQVVTGAGNPQDYILLPFVNQRRWGAHERATAGGKTTWSIPLPNPGPAHIQVLALKSDTAHWMGLADAELLMAGVIMPQGVGRRSNLLEVDVTWRSFPKPEPSETLFCMQWEPWFYRGIKGWTSSHAVPATGFYDFTDRNLLRQNLLWFMDLGVDFVMFDWSNHIWGCKHWDERNDHVNGINHATEMALEVMAEMRNEGLPVPRACLMPGISNGPPATMEALNEQLNWIYHYMVRNPRFEGLWQEFEGKPLSIILDTGAVGDKRGTAESAFRIPFFKHTLGMSEEQLDAWRAAQGPVDDSHFTIRWMSSQNQATRHHELGYWSWMDGVIDPLVTYLNDKAEAVTVTPSFFNALGWTGPLARGRLGGSVYIETFKTALIHRPKVVFLHQWNEFTGQEEGKGMGIPGLLIYADSYSVELSDDLEPVSLTAPGYRGDKGGWGYYYLNLTRALMDLYRGKAEDSTLMAVSSPQRGEEVSTTFLKVAWSVIGKPVESFNIAVDGKVVRRGLSSTEVEIAMAGLAAGLHTLTVTAEASVTRFPLSYTTLDEPLESDIPLKIDVPFRVL